jgi:sugar phosphate isomerase/epimerase
LLAMADRAADPRLGVEFSPEHALVMQENILDLIDRYTPHIHNVCYADRRVVQDDLARFDGHYYYVRYEPCWNGDGIVPTASMLDGLARGGFDDYITLKYERSATYGRHLPPAPLALEHFPGFIGQFPGFAGK